MATITEPVGEGPWQRLIVKYRPGSGPGRDPEAAKARLQDTASQSGLAGDGADPVLRLTWRRRLGIDADLVQAGRPLGRAEALRLMDAFAADPDVEYVEADATMRAF